MNKLLIHTQAAAMIGFYENSSVIPNLNLLSLDELCALNTELVNLTVDIFKGILDGSIVCYDSAGPSYCFKSTLDYWKAKK